MNALVLLRFRSPGSMWCGSNSGSPELGQSNVDGRARTVTHDVDRHGPAHSIAGHELLETRHVVDDHVIDLDDHVVGPQSGVARGLPTTTDDTEAPTGAPRHEPRRRQGPCPPGDAKISTTHTTLVHQRRDDLAGGPVDGHGQPKTLADHGSDDCGVDADHLAGVHGQRTSGVARVQCRVGLDDVVDEPGRVPRARCHRAAEAADHAGTDPAGKAQRVSDRDDQLSDDEVCGSPRTAGTTGAPSRGHPTRMTAKSDKASAPTTENSISRPSAKVAVPPSPAPTTCAEVKMNPSGVTTTPEPAPTAWCSPLRALVTRKLATLGPNRRATSATTREYASKRPLDGNRRLEGLRGAHAEPSLPVAPANVTLTSNSSLPRTTRSARTASGASASRMSSSSSDVASATPAAPTNRSPTRRSAARPDCRAPQPGSASHRVGEAHRPTKAPGDVGWGKADAQLDAGR